MGVIPVLELIASGPRLRLLRYLSTHEGPFTGRELAREVGLDPKNASVALRQLVDAGVVQRRRAGRAYLYSLDRDSYLAHDVLLPAFSKERSWQQALGSEIKAAVGPGVESVILYGSWARGQAGPRSDIDLLLVIGARRSKAAVEGRLSDQRARLVGRFRHIPSFLVLSRQEFRKRLGRGDPLVREIVEQGQVLAGKTTSELVAHD